MTAYLLTEQQHAALIANCGSAIGMEMLKAMKPQEPCGQIVSIDGWKENSPANRMATFHGVIPAEGMHLYTLGDTA